VNRDTAKRGMRAVTAQPSRLRVAADQCPQQGWNEAQPQVVRRRRSRVICESARLAHVPTSPTPARRLPTSRSTTHPNFRHSSNALAARCARARGSDKTSDGGPNEPTFASRTVPAERALSALHCMATAQLRGEHGGPDVDLARRIRFIVGVACLLTTLCGALARADPPPADGGDSASSPRDDRRTSVDSVSELAELSLAREPETSRAALSSLSPDTIAALLQRYASEPTAIKVVRAAIKASEREPDRFASMLRRARWRGLVPTLSLGARRGQGVDLRTTVTEDDGVRFTSGDDLVLSATLRFELGRLLFADEEVTIAREARAARAIRLELVRDVIHWYYLRRRLQLERDALGHTSVTRELKIAEIEALLDAFTNGAFGRMIGGQRKEWTIDESTPGSRPR